MSTETTDYIPQRGDVVVFPGAPMAWNRETRYVIIGNGRHVGFRMEGDTDSLPYLYSLKELRAIGMRKADEAAKA